jgi:hypothetical protein
MKLARTKENRINNKAIVVRVPQSLWDQIKTDADSEKLSITEKARRYLTKGMEKTPSNS